MDKSDILDVFASRLATDISLPCQGLFNEKLDFKFSSQGFGVQSLEMLALHGGSYRRQRLELFLRQPFVLRFKPKIWPESETSRLDLSVFLDDFLDDFIETTDLSLDWRRCLALLIESQQPFDTSRIECPVVFEFELAESNTPKIEEWLRCIFPSTYQNLGEAWFMKQIAEYRNELGRPDLLDVAPVEGLRYFSPFLRGRLKKENGSLSLSEQVNLEWLRSQALLSPHDEWNELQSLATRELMLNPTHQVCKVQFCNGQIFNGQFRKKDDDNQLGEIELLSVFRADHLSHPRTHGTSLASEVYERKLNWPEALLIDLLSEAGRCSRQMLLAEAEQHSAAFSKDKTHQLSPQTESFSIVLDRLIENGIVLSNSNF